MVEGSSNVGRRKIHDLRSHSVCPLLSVSSDIFISLRGYERCGCIFAIGVCFALPYAISSISFSVTSLNVQRMRSFPTCFSPWLKIIDWRRPTFSRDFECGAFDRWIYNEVVMSDRYFRANLSGIYLK